ncbi:MAG: hypothetical protein QM688_14400 [Sphingomonas bacterium]
MGVARNISNCLPFGVSAIALAAAAPAFAQQSSDRDTAQAAGPDGLQDVVVTARRTEERAQTVPVAITAFTQDTIREKAIGNGTDLQNFTPSLTVLGDVARNQETYTIRGMGGHGAGHRQRPGRRRLFRRSADQRQRTRQFSILPRFRC